MTDIELQTIADAVRDLVDERVAAVREPLLREIAELRARVDTPPVFTVTDEISRACCEEIDLRIAALPKPKDGIDGRDGADGINGKDGVPGERGPQGERGTDGTRGERGPVGEPGKNGEPGERGERGLPGESIVGERGADGAPGTNGIDGKDGAHGERGLPGERGLIGLPGGRGEDGKDGRDGRDGTAGRDGEPGRDALELDILPSVDLTKSYPRGTFASYAGGMIRSIRRTDPVTTGLAEAGWAVIVDGLCDPDVQQLEDLRTIAVTMRLTSGALVTRQFTMPMLIYRGVFKEGDEYTRGDAVTWAGSTWHCQAESTKAKPGEGSADWKLMVKRGAAGKDGVLPTPPDKGPVKL